MKAADMSEELPVAEGCEAETKVIYFIDEESIPYSIRVPVPAAQVTLGDFKAALDRDNYKFFFRSHDDDIGEVKEEISEDTTKLPTSKGRVISWLVTADGSAHSDSSAGAKKPPLPRGTPHKPSTGFSTAAAAFDDTAATSDTESTISGLPQQFMKHGSRLDRRTLQPQFGQAQRFGRRGRGGEADSAITSDSDTARFLDSEDDRSRVSTSTGITSVSQQFYRQRKRRKKHRPPVSRTSSFTSITESSMSLNIIKVVLNMDTVNFLGISIVGQSNQRGDGGIFVANIMKGGAVALDGRIEPGDMILQVNETSFENMSNDDAVNVLREAVHKSGRIELVVAKCFDPSPKGYFTIPRQEPVRPIDPGAWVAHTNAMRGPDTPTPFRPPSVSTMASQNSGSLTSSVPESDRYAADMHLVKEMDMLSIVRAMARPDSGLDIKNRTWLKITIPMAFLGSDLVEWLHTNVHGFTDRREARRYAAALLKEGYIKHTVNKITFSEQCYYVFGELCNDLTRLRLMEAPEKPTDDGGQSEHDTVGPLPPPPAPWGTHPTAPSMASGYASMPFQYTNEGGSFPSLNTAPTMAMGGPGTTTTGFARSDDQSAASNGSGGSSGSGEKKKLCGTGPPSLLPKPAVHPSVRAIQEVPRDLAGSRQSFRIAMGNPCEFFVDVM